MTNEETRNIIILGACVIGVGIWLKREAAEVVENVGEAINPINRENIFYRGANAIGETITGENGWSVGSAWYDVWNSPKINHTN